MNVKLLRKIQKHILAEPRRYDQNHWMLKGVEIERRGLPMPPCGTMGCIAGWVCALNGEEVNTDRAAKLLGLDTFTASRLFDAVMMREGNWNLSQWPEKFQKAYAKAKTPAGRARAGVRRIDHFIKTKGAE